MIVLSVLAALLAVAAVWFLVRPLLRGTSVPSQEPYYQLAAARDRVLGQLNELDLHERDRSMDAGIAADERARLEGELAGVLKNLEALTPDAEPAEAGRPTKPVWRNAVVALALIVPSAAVAIYLINVTVSPLMLAKIAPTLRAGAAGAPDPAQMVARLERRLQENPDDVNGWLRLGRSYVVLGRQQEAMVAYDRAYQLLPKNYQPESADAMYFLGLAAHGRGETKRAIDLWSKLLAALPPDSESAKQLEQVIEQARRGPKAAAPVGSGR